MEQVEKATVTEAATPTHCDAAYVEKALQVAYKSESLRLETLQSEPITQCGENFCSVIYRLKVAYRKCENSPIEHDNLILKDLLPIVAAVGSNEKLMFERILPEMGQILEKAASTLSERKLSANCLFAEREASKEIYLLEDLGALGYALFDRQTGLSLEDALICMQKMGQFHGASMMLMEEQPQLVAQLAPSHYADGISDPFATVIVVGGTDYAAGVVAKMPGMADIAAKMKAQLPDEYARRIRSIVDPKNSAISVIVHGDLWVNNMMVNAEQKKSIIVDFQNCFIGSPAVDLHFFFYTSLQLEVLLHKQEQLLQKYYQSLCETLTACKYRGCLPSYAQLTDEMQRCLFYGYYGVACELPICCAANEASVDFTVDTFISAEALLEKRHQLFASERVRQTLQATLGHFDQQGVLNIQE
ncbi:uncharacterized protein LOC6558209 [Drosophila grimshawi]|uniref:GH14448 n=1 Tax=Drosophila grimshawi TaxID=7222 RepID=B4J0N3_DROGR|nr:uncharacterized protein LOC6558209 [Drosophila grimshawi]EDV97888.1 GH14448 [Drosophila grimshawi]